MGTKYIIEVEDKPFELLSENGFTSEKLFRVKGFNSLVFDWNGLNMLTPYTEPDMEQVRKEAYEQGLSDAKEWKATCQYCEYEYIDETEEPCKKCCNAYMNKYKPKAKEEQIQVGDEVINQNKTAVVTEITNRYTRIMYSDGSGYALFAKGLTKTGRHFPEIAEVLQKMKES